MVNYYQFQLIEKNNLFSLMLDKIFLIMKMSFFLFVLSVNAVFASESYAQNTFLTLSMTDKTVTEVLDEIERQSEFRFYYNSKLVDTNRKVNVNTEESDVFTVLNQLFTATTVGYKVVDKDVILVKKDAKDSSPQIAVAFQGILVTGRVTDEANEPIPSANVIVKGTTIGQVTDNEGVYSINVPDNNAVLVISFIGYITQEIEVGNRRTINVTLSEDTKQMEEVVVVGYGIVRKSDLTSSVTSVRAEDMTVSATPNITSALQGIAPGVEVSRNSASPGGSIDIRIRGIGTLNSNTPLYVVDGVPVNSLEFVNTNDIERLEILKDATSSAIYGSRGSNGVVLITTKSGQNANGQYTINFESTYGVQALGHKMKLADASEFAKIYNDAREASNVAGRIDLNSIRGKGTDWINEITNSAAPMQTYNLSVTGGNNRSSLSAGIGYFGQDGVVKSSDYERYSFRLNSMVQANEVVSFNFGMIAGYTFRNMISGEKDQYGGILFNAFLIDPITEVMKPVSEWVENPFSNYARSQYTMIGNPVGVMARTFNNSKQYSGIANAGMKLDFTKNLSFKTNFGIDYRESKTKNFSPDYLINPSEKNDYNSISNSNSNRFSYVWENTANYQNIINNIHRINVLAGYTMEYNVSESLSASRSHLPGNTPELQYIQLATQNPSANGDYYKNTMISYLGRVNYSLMDRYIVTANFRADGSSRFAKGNKWGFFPSISGAWVISNEDFFSKLASVNYLKLRLGYGQIGNQNISNYAYIDQVRNTYRYPFDDVLYAGFATYTPGNRNIKWETTEDVTLGIDGGLWRNRLTWTIDLYSRTTKDMLLRNPVPGYTGLFSSATSLSAGIWDNVGSIQNKGIEVSLEYRGNINQLKYRVGGNISFVKNEITELGDVTFISGGNIRGMGDITRSEVKSSIARFWGYRTDGLFKSEAEVNAYAKDGNLIQPNAKPGDLKFVDINNDGQITDADKDWLGSALPKFTSGFNLILEYKGFDFKSYFYLVSGNDIMDANSVFYSSGKDVYNSLAGTYDKAWNPNNPNATCTRLTSRDENGNYQRFSDYIIQDGSYLRLKDVQIGYNFNTNLISKIGMSKLRLYIAAQNLFTVTSYKGLEPETSSSSVTTLGIDLGNYPTARSFLLGLNVSF